MGHIVLLGDSIFDHGRYVPGGPAVVEHLRRILSSDWKTTLLAVDGAITSDVGRQLARLPADATHLVVSVGGNNALEEGSVSLYQRVESVVGALSKLAEIRANFERDYRDMLRGVIECRKPVVVCTIYDAIPDLSRADHAGLCLFNDVILREAFRFGLPVIDLRLVCNEATDYAQTSPIEPCVLGGGKIARAIWQAVSQHDFASGQSKVFW